MTVWAWMNGQPGTTLDGYAGVVSQVLRELGSPERCDWVDSLDKPHDFQIRIQSTGVVELGGYHARLFDRLGRLIYDPGRELVPDLGLAAEIHFIFAII